MPNTYYNVNLPQFEGSLDLLLHLINTNKVDIYDIPIALITKQYLEYVDIMRELDLNIASDFIVMASRLIYIKSCLLLPPDEDSEGNQLLSDDPRISLVEQLLAYQAYKEASVRLKEMEEIRQRVFPRPVSEENHDLSDDCFFLSEVSIFDLMAAVKNILKNITPESYEIIKETLTVKDRIESITEKIQGESAIHFQDFFSGQDTRIKIIVTFLALLEILKMGIAKAFQDNEFGNIWIIRKCNAGGEMRDSGGILKL